jgi:NADH-quinone oxidoreductase subunit C
MSDEGTREPGGEGGGSPPGKKKPKQWPPEGQAPATEPPAGEKAATAGEPGKKRAKKWPPEDAAPAAASADGPGKKEAKRWPPDEAPVAAGEAPKKKPKTWPPAPGEAAAEGGKKKAKKWPPDPADAAPKEEKEEKEAPKPAPKPAWEVDPVAPEWEDAGDDEVAGRLRERFGDAIERARRFAGDVVIEVARDSIREVCAELAGPQAYKLLVDVTAAHYPDREAGRFEVVYIAYSFESNRRVRLKVRTDDGEPVPTVVPVWKGAEWLEREIWDMFGVTFEGHPDMTRILLWEGFNGHPLRKDFPVEGIDTGSAIYPEYYDESAGPVTGTGTGWKPKGPPEEADTPNDA